MAPDSIWPGMFHADAGRAESVSNTRSVSSDMAATYAIFDEQRASKKVLDNWQPTAVNKGGMSKKAISVLLAGLALIWVHLVQAQQQAKVFTIGWLGIGSASSVVRYEEFRRALRELGYIEGKNTNYEYRSADNRLDRLPSLADELVRLKVDLIITRGTPESVALKNATKTIPIVFYDVTDPIGAGLVDSLARPGGNITGFSGIEAVLAGKRLELLKEIIPKLSRVAVLWNPADLSSVQQW